MKIELLIIGITIFVLLNTYFDGKLVNKLKSYTKYYKMALFAFIGLCVILFIRKNPSNYRDLVYNANSYIKYLPIDRNTSSMISPIIDFTTRSISNEIKSNYNNNYNPQQSANFFNSISNNTNHNYNNLTHQQRKILTSGNKTTKRSVSETKKKYVAANQSWCCKHCKNQLNAWFEVDHVVKLEYGGSNNIDNLEALCRECHGKKTACENL
jgi:5-methylcytosine-specific restriction endonuclease McrA